MSEQKIIFGTDGWRGLLDSEVTIKNVAAVAQAFSDYLLARIHKIISPQVAVAYDGRTNSKVFATIFARVLAGNNIRAFLSDTIVPTPVLSYYIKHHSLDAGVMITASHNPAVYNGIKFKAAYGGPFFTEETREVEKLIGSSLVQTSDSFHTVDFLHSYIKHVEGIIDFETIRDSSLSVLIDSMSGAGGTLLQRMLEEYQIPCKTIYGVPREDFDGRNAEPIEKNLVPLKDELQNQPGFALGVATDGDADRLGVLLENGDWLSAQETILLLTDYIVNKRNFHGAIVKTSSVTDKIRRFESPRRKVIDVQVGFKYICEAMINETVAIGCEESGGYGFKGHIPERDGILSALYMMEMIANSGCKSLSEYANQKREEFGIIHYNRIDLPTHANNRLEILPLLAQGSTLKIAGFSITGKQEFLSSRGIINGLKLVLEGTSRWILFRASETEPLFRIYAEAESATEVESLLQSGEDIIKRLST